MTFIGDNDRWTADEERVNCMHIVELHKRSAPSQRVLLYSISAFLMAVAVQLLGARSADAQTADTTGFVKEMRLDSGGTGNAYILVRLSQTIGGASMTTCRSGQTYAIFYGPDNLEDFRSILSAASLAGRMVTIRSTYQSNECRITRVVLSR